MSKKLEGRLRYYLNYLVTRVAKSIEVPSRYEARCYVGIRDPKNYRCFVNVLGDDGKEYPLKPYSRAYLEAEPGESNIHRKENDNNKSKDPTKEKTTTRPLTPVTCS
jgi:hypothetical protein